MIDPDLVVQLHTVSHTKDPPVITCFLMIFPIIKWISPQLTSCGKSVWRTSCHCCRCSLLIKLEQIRVRPCICAVKSHIDRKITDDLNTSVICIFLQPAPLAVEPELLKGIEADILLQLLSCLSKRLRLTCL